MIPESFHFLRPAWLLVLLPLALVAWAAAQSGLRASAWRRVVDAHLLRHLVETDAGATRRWPLTLGVLGGAAACLALAGPTWERLPQPAFSSVAPTVVALDLSPSMQADDLAPSRLGRARLELHDLLERSKGGQIGLVLYTDEPFVAAPLTDDARLVAEMIPTLESGLMPLRPARPDRAIAQATALLDQAGAASGRVLLITDGLGEHAGAALDAARALAASGRTLSVLGAATLDGAPARDARRRVVRDADGNAVTSRLEHDALEQLAHAGGGRFSEIRADDADLAIVAPVAATGAAKAAASGSSAQLDAWRDAGPWLVLIPLLIAPLFFRRGLVAALALCVLAASPARAEASTWSDLWSRRDQQAQAALAAGDAATAAQLFEDPAWKAAARYRSGEYQESVESYAGLEGADNRYNLGNALARSGKLEDALAAYDEVLAQDTAHADAKFNRDLVQHLLDEQRKQQEQKRQQQGEQGPDGEQRGEQQSAGRQPGSSDDAQQPQSSAGAGERPDAGEQRDASAQAQPPDAGDEAAQQHASAATPSDAPEQQQQQDTARASAGRADDDADPPHDAAAARDAAERNAAAQEDRSLAQSLDQALANAASTETAADAETSADAEAAEAHAAAEQDAPPPGDPRGNGPSAMRRPMTDQEQAREQALRNIPDDPAGLLRAKIRRQYAEKRYARQEVSPSW